MTIESLESLFKKHDSEYLKFGKVEDKVSKRCDLHALMILDKLIPDTGRMITFASPNIIYLEIDCEELAEIITEDQVIELIRCGVCYSTDNDGLTINV